MDEPSIALAVEQVADSVVITDPRGTILYVNAGFTRMTGYERDEAIGRKPSMLKSGRQDPVWYERLWRTILSGNTFSGTLINRRKDGSQYHEEMTITPVRDAAGAVVRFVAIKRDVTGRLQAEEDQRRYKAIFEASRDALLMADSRTGMLMEGNPAAVALLGRPIEEIRKMHQSEVHADSENGRAAFRRFRDASGRSENLIRRPDGSTVPVEISASPMKDALGRDMVLGVFHDLTERNQAEKELRQSEEKFRQLAENISEVFWMADAPDGVVRYVSPAFERLWERSFEDMFRDPDAWLEAVQPEDRALAMAPVRTLQTGEKTDSEYRIRTPGGRQKWIRVRSFPVYDEKGTVVRLVGIGEDVTDRKAAETALAYQARHDFLTGLPNRLQIGEFLESAIRRAGVAGGMLAVIYIDLDGFKFANDTLGHEAGDVLLQQVTCRLRSCVRDSDTLARMGGDEFMAVIGDIREVANAISVAEKLRLVLRKPFQVSGHELYLTGSIGIAVYPRDGLDPGVLRSNADAAMYEAKHRGKDRVRLFMPGMRQQFEERLRLDTDLRRAIEGNQLSLQYQPIFNVRDERLVAFEALLRWKHPLLGWIPPDRFVPQAEESGLIAALGSWAMEAACRECRAWQERGMAGVRVGVNVSAIEFSMPEFPERVLRVLEQTGLTGDLLDLELTESTTMGDAESFIRRMLKLRERGIRISIDDFGTGYSSLGYLPRLPVDALKIDRSFVSGLEEEGTARPLVQGIISLAHSIGKKVVVEGVETPGQLGILRSLCADEVQGYLLGRPVAVPEAVAQTGEAAVPFGTAASLASLADAVLMDMV